VKRLRRRVPTIVLLIVVGVVSYLWWTTRSVPAWFTPPEATEARRERAWQVEQRFAEEFSKVRAEAPLWALRVRESDLNTWLADRLRPWAEHRGSWPEQLGDVQVHLSPDTVVLGVELRDLDTVAFLEGVPEEGEDGSIALRWTAAGIGRLRIPWPERRVRAAILGRLRGGELADLEALLDGVSVPGAIGLPDGRVVSVLGGEIGDGEAVLELVTAPGD
jgi:hypothetical protein